MITMPFNELYENITTASKDGKLSTSLITEVLNKITILNNMNIKDKLELCMHKMQVQYLKGVILSLDSPLKNPKRANGFFTKCITLLPPYEKIKNLNPNKEQLESFVLLCNNALHYINENAQNGGFLFGLVKQELLKVFSYASAIQEYLSLEVWQDSLPLWIELMNLLLQSKDYVLASTVGKKLKEIYPCIPEINSSYEYRVHELHAILQMTQLLDVSLPEERINLINSIITDLKLLKEIGSKFPEIKPNFNSIDIKSLSSQKEIAEGELAEFNLEKIKELVFEYAPMQNAHVTKNNLYPMLGKPEMKEKKISEFSKK